MKTPEFDIWQNWKPLSLWERFLLLFKKSYYTIDMGNDKDKTVRLKFKVIKDKVYLIEGE